ncbi:hypothetical protein N0V88_006315 [Collariella sp. IMI 366227]|nr:hypothetical protein N0V88_006315 [Collariella sp. IMI 366227]
MPSFSARYDPSDPYQSLSNAEDDGMMEDLIPTKATHHSKPTPSLHLRRVLDLPSPPSTPLRSNYYSLSHSAFSSFSSPTYTLPSSPLSQPRQRPQPQQQRLKHPATARPPPPPTLANPLTTHPRLPNPGSRSASSASSTTSSPSQPNNRLSPNLPSTHRPMQQLHYRPRKTHPYYPPNASRNVDHKRIYMNRGPHYIANWTPLGSLPKGCRRN